MGGLQLNAQDILALPAPRAAPALLGWRLAVPGIEARICETEAYHGEDDRGCHASRGRTPRTEALYAPGGTLYVYLCYGMHWMLNLVCEPAGVPSAVLIRGVLIAGVDARRTNGPGKVAKALGIDRRLHGLVLGERCPLSLLPPDDAVPRRRNGARVGIAYAGPRWAGRRWRWWVEGFPALTA